MKMTKLFSFFLFMRLALAGTDYSKLLVISYDGFRYDYLNEILTPNLNSLKEIGTYSRFMLNVFPTQTFPNHFSIATGLYTEVHGVLASHVFDKDSKTVMNYSYPLFHYSNDITPIWTLNEKAEKGRHSGVMMWPGSNFEYNGYNATFIVPYNPDVKWETRVDTVISWFKHPKTPANFVMMYFEEPDADEHIFGPDSEQTKVQIKRTDKITQYILDSLKTNQLDDVNLIFLSDHGMDGVKEKNIVNLTAFLDYESNMYGSSPALQIYPKYDQQHNAVLKQLKKRASKQKTFKVYDRKNIPKHFHYKHCTRAPPILAVAEPGHAFQDLYYKIQEYKKSYNVTDDDTFGVHGYDPKSVKMHPFFLAKGPVFKKNYIVKSEIHNIDLYLLFTHVLNLELPPVRPNGTYAHISEVFDDNE